MRRQIQRHQDQRKPRAVPVAHPAPSTRTAFLQRLSPVMHGSDSDGDSSSSSSTARSEPDDDPRSHFARDVQLRQRALQERHDAQERYRTAASVLVSVPASAGPPPRMVWDDCPPGASPQAIAAIFRALPPGSLPPRVKRDMERLFNGLLRTECRNALLTPAQWRRHRVVRHRRQLEAVAAVHVPMREALVSMWDRFRVGAQEREGLTARCFGEPSIDAFRAMAAEVHHFALRDDSNELLTLFGTRERVRRALLDTASDPALRNPDLPEHVADGLGVKVVNSVLHLRHITCCIMDAVCGMREREDAMQRAEEAEHGPLHDDESLALMRRESSAGPSRRASHHHLAVISRRPSVAPPEDPVAVAVGVAPTVQRAVTAALWEGTNYILRMQDDLAALGSTPLGELLGGALSVHHNPLLLPGDWPRSIALETLAPKQLHDRGPTTGAFLRDLVSGAAVRPVTQEDQLAELAATPGPAPRTINSVGPLRAITPTPVRATPLPGTVRPSDLLTPHRAVPLRTGTPAPLRSAARATTMLRGLEVPTGPSSLSLAEDRAFQSRPSAIPAGDTVHVDDPRRSYRELRAEATRVDARTAENRGPLASVGRGDRRRTLGMEPGPRAATPLAPPTKRPVLKVLRPGEEDAVVAQKPSQRAVFFRRLQQQQERAQAQDHRDSKATRVTSPGPREGHRNLYHFKDDIVVAAQQSHRTVMRDRILRSLEPDVALKAPRYDDAVTTESLAEGGVSKPPGFTKGTMVRPIAFDQASGSYRPASAAGLLPRRELLQRALLIFGEGQYIRSSAARVRLRNAYNKCRVAYSGFLDVMGRVWESEAGGEEAFEDAQRTAADDFTRWLRCNAADWFPSDDDDDDGGDDDAFLATLRSKARPSLLARRGSVGGWVVAENAAADNDSVAPDSDDEDDGAQAVRFW